MSVQAAAHSVRRSQNDLDVVAAERFPAMLDSHVEMDETMLVPSAAPRSQQILGLMHVRIIGKESPQRVQERLDGEA